MAKVASGAKPTTGRVTPALARFASDRVSRVNHNAAPLSNSASPVSIVSTVTPNTP